MLQRNAPAASPLGRSLYRRILRELRATRTNEHHLRDIRTLLWVPGTQGKRRFDSLKQLAHTSWSLSPTRKASATAASSCADAGAPSLSTTPPSTAEQTSNTVVKRFEPRATPSIADQIRAVARGLFSGTPTTAASSSEATPAPSPADAAIRKAKAIQEGSARAFWAIKRLQDIRAGTVPTASMWLTGPHQHKPNAFDPFTNAREMQVRSGAFPFLPEFLGVEQGASEDVIESEIGKLKTMSRTSSKLLKLEVAAKCACAEGPSARYHVTFRLENITDAAIDVKLAHLFAVRAESPPVLTEMVSVLPLLGNAILRPESVRLSGVDDDDMDGEDDDEAPASAAASASAAAGAVGAGTESATTAATSAAATTASLPSASALSLTATQKTKLPGNCAVYDVSLPVQGECVLRGVVFYRVITNALPSADAADDGTSSSAPPSSVRSRLKALHFLPIKLSPNSSN